MMIKSYENFNQLIALFSDLRCNRIPGQLVIQLTDRCNAFCPQCGMRVTKKFKRSTLSADIVKRIIDAAAQKGVNVVSFTGGEPCLFLDQLVMFIKYAGGFLGSSLFLILINQIINRFNPFFNYFIFF